MGSKARRRRKDKDVLFIGQWRKLNYYSGEFNLRKTKEFFTGLSMENGFRIVILEKTR